MRIESQPTLSGKATLCLALISPLVLLVHGYHPLADDGAVYVAGIKKLADPALYPSDAVFALSPTRLSVFAHVLAALVRWFHLPLPALLLVCHLASIFLFLVGCWKVAAHIFSTPGSRWGAVLLAACCFTLPVAGTSLDIMDPYVTARSFSTPLSLLALAAVLEERWLRSALLLTVAALLHPLMAAYTAILLAGVALAQRTKWRQLTAFYGLGWALAGLLFLLKRQGEEQSPFQLAALSRSYFFLSSWEWYEYLGLVIPLLLLVAAIVSMRATNPARPLAIAVTGIGGCALLTSLCFVHRSGSLLLARLQVLRAFQWVYLAGVLLAGGLLGSLTRQSRRMFAVIYLLVALSLFAGQRLTYPASSHIEWPGRAPQNQWEQAFWWIRDHTPKDALFALDNDYVELAGEDAQGFRATAERSTVADYYKDGGIAGNFPAAADRWWQGAQATAHLDEMDDAARIGRLRPFGATWIVLPVQASTHLLCPFTNAAVRVCRLSILIHGAEGAK